MKKESCFRAGALVCMCSPVLSSLSRTLGPVNEVECGVRLPGDRTGRSRQVLKYTAAVGYFGHRLNS